MEVECRKGFDLCTYFPVGFVPFIQHEMYDVMIEVPPLVGDALDELNWVHVDFHVAYFSEAYTT